MTILVRVLQYKYLLRFKVYQLLCLKHKNVQNKLYNLKTRLIQLKEQEKAMKIATCWN